MITSTHDLLKNFFWRYADMHITKRELHFLRNHCVKNSAYVDFLTHHGHLLRHPTTDVVNLSTILSQLSEADMVGLLQFFSVRSGTPTLITNFDELQDAIGDDPTMFYTFVVSMYYYL